MKLQLNTKNLLICGHQFNPIAIITSFYKEFKHPIDEPSAQHPKSVNLWLKCLQSGICPASQLVTHNS